MSIESKEHPFLVELSRAIESGSSRTIVLTGNVQDLAHLKGDNGGTYVPLVDLLSGRLNVTQFVPVTYELNGPVKFLNAEDQRRFVDAWVRFQTGKTTAEEAGEAKIARFMDTRAKVAQETVADAFAGQLEEAAGKPAYALELLRAMCACSRAMAGGKPIFVDKAGAPLHLIVIVEGADLLIPEGQASSLSDSHLQRIAICRDWFSDLGFLEGGDTVILISESRSLLNERVAKLPQLGEVEIPFPDDAERLRFIRWFVDRQVAGLKPTFWSTDEGCVSNDEELAAFTAGLTIHALRQLLIGASHDAAAGRGPLKFRAVTKQVERFIQAQLGGDEVVEFLRPEHKIADLIGFEELKQFIIEEIIPGLRLMTKDAISSIIVCGPNRSGKTYTFEGVGGELGIPILVLKNLRSQWFGQTDVIFGRLKRVLEVLRKVLIYVNEADTQFGSISGDAHETEKRLTGRLQAMMSDTKLKGRVHWILDTARPHLLSVDIRQAGRGGDVIVAVFDPEGEQRKVFIRWALEHVLDAPLDEATMARVDAATQEYSVGAFTTLRSKLKRKATGTGGKLTVDAVLAIVEDTLLPDVALERLYQTIQGALNCTSKRLLAPSYRNVPREVLYKKVVDLEAAGIS